jgi:hypothetical protein
MHEWIHAGVGHIRVLLEIKCRIEERTGIAPFARAVFKIMACDVDWCIANVGIFLAVPNRVDQRGVVQKLDLLG